MVLGWASLLLSVLVLGLRAACLKSRSYRKISAGSFGSASNPVCVYYRNRCPLGVVSKVKLLKKPNVAFIVSEPTSLAYVSPGASFSLLHGHCDRYQHYSSERRQQRGECHKEPPLYDQLNEGGKMEKPEGFPFNIDPFSIGNPNSDRGVQNRKLIKDKADGNESEEGKSEELTEEAKPGDITDGEIMKMKIALAQEATLGLDFVKVIETLQTSPYSTVSPTTIAYNATLSAAERNSNAHLALSVLEDMKKKGNVIDGVSYKLAISTCAKCGYTSEAMQLYDEMLQKGHAVDHGVMRALMGQLAREGRGPDCSRIFEDMKKLEKVNKAGETFLQQEDYSKLIEACAKSEMYLEGQMAYKEMQTLKDYKITPNLVTWMLTIYHGANWWQEALELYALMLKESQVLTSYQYKLLMGIMLLARKHGELESIYNTMQKEGVPLDRVSCQLLLENWAKTGQFQKSLTLIETMESRNYLHGVYEPFIAAAESCRQSGEWKLALKLLRMSNEHNSTLSIAMYNTVLSVFASAEEWDSIVSLYREIEAACKGSQGITNKFSMNGDTVAYAVMAHFYTGDKAEVDRLLRLPIVDTTLLLKLRGSINAENGGATCNVKETTNG